jgi:hypothetical protein
MEEEKFNYNDLSNEELLDIYNLLDEFTKFLDDELKKGEEEGE